jgi:GNAT superfamily N-acetyltransferase
MADIEYRLRTEPGADFRSLAEELDAELARANGAAQARYDGFNGLDGLSDLVAAYDGPVPVGCAALKPLGGGRFEVKRVYVREAWRRHGVARGLMAELERAAHRRGAASLVLETSRGFTAALGLYEGLGYRVIPNYGQYAGMELSVCLEKLL